MKALLLVAIVVIIAIVLLNRSNASKKRHDAEAFEDAIAEARRWNERLGSQVLTLSGIDAASTQALADAAERHNAAASQISQAQTVRQAEMAKQSAVEGLHYVEAAREILSLPKNPGIPGLEGQQQAGRVTENRTIEHEGHRISASPSPSDATPNYYPGGTVAGRPVPAGWYSEPWWGHALSTGMWTAASVMLFSSMFSGMHGVNYSADAFEQGYAEGLADANDHDFDADADAGDFGDFDFDF